jgi:hypothetical protein
VARFGKFKDKLDLKKFKDKIDNLGILKSKLDNLKENLDNLDNSEAEQSFTPIKTTKGESIRQKYKSMSLLSKTKQILQGYESLEESYLPPEDLGELQSDLSKISAEIKEEGKKEVKWESIKIGFSLEKETNRIEKLINLREYWMSEFYSLFKKYSEENTLTEVSRFFHTHLKLKFPLLARLLEKIKIFNHEDDDILLLL